MVISKLRLAMQAEGYWWVQRLRSYSTSSNYECIPISYHVNQTTQSWDTRLKMPYKYKRPWSLVRSNVNKCCRNLCCEQLITWPKNKQPPCHLNSPNIALNLPVWLTPVEYMVLRVQVKFAHSLLKCSGLWVGHNLCLLWDYLCLLYPC